MTNWFVDPWETETKYSGDSGVVDAEGTDGVTNGTTTFTSATGGFTGLAGRYIKIDSWFRYIVSVESDISLTVDSTMSSGSGRTWAIGGPQRYPSALGTTYVAAGDVICYPETPYSAASAAGDMDWTNQDETVAIASGKISIVSECESGWVGNTGVTVTHTTNMSGSGNCLTLTLSGASAGKLAYYDFGSGTELDLSNFQGVSLLMQTRGSTAWDYTDDLRICFCSDATGDTIVDDLSLPFGSNIYFGAQFPITAYKSSGDLPASVRSIAIYCTGTPSNVTMDFDNIVAILDQSDSAHLCHCDLISQGNSFLDDIWWGIHYFSSATSLELCGEFYGTSQSSHASYKREVTLMDANAQTVGLGDGEIDNEITVRGGYDFSTETQTGITAVYTHLYSATTPARFNHNIGNDWYIYEDFIFGMADYNMLSMADDDLVGITIQDCLFAAMGSGDCGSAGIYFDVGSSYDQSSVSHTIRRCRFTGIVNGYGIWFDASVRVSHSWCLFDDVRVLSCRGVGFEALQHSTFRDFEVSNCYYITNPCGLVLSFDCRDLNFHNLTIKDSYRNGMDTTYGNDYGSQGIRIFGLTASGNTDGTFAVGRSTIEVFDATISDGTIAAELTYGGRVAIMRDGSADNHIIYAGEGTIQDETSVRHTASDISWKLSPTNALEVPLRLHLGQIALATGSRTISLYMRRDNTGISGKFFTPGGQVLGVDLEEDTISTAADIWDLLTLSMTPTEDGVVDIYVDVWGGTTYSIYIDDLSVT